MFENGVRPPVKFYPVVPPDPIAGGELPGNKDKVDTSEEGKVFLKTVYNLLQGSVKLFGQDEAISWDSYFWPGIEMEETPQNKFDFINYVGKEKKQVYWGKTDETDYNFNGKIEKNENAKSVLPFAQYTKQGAGKKESGAEIDYGNVWDEALKNLSSKDSFGDVVKFKTADLSGDQLKSLKDLSDLLVLDKVEQSLIPKEPKQKFAFLIGLLETKRRWVYAMDALGIDVYNYADMAKRFLYEVFGDPHKLGKAGGVNIQGLSNYLANSLGFAVRFNDCAEAAALLKADAIKYLAELPAYTNASKSAAFNVVASIKKNVSPKGVVFYTYTADKNCELNQIKTELGQKTRDILNLLPFSDEIKDRLNDFAGVFDAIPANDEQAALKYLYNNKGAFQTAKTLINSLPNKIIEGIYAELNTKLSSEISDDYKTGVKGVKDLLFSATKPAMEYISNVKGLNLSLSAINRINSKRYQQQKDEKHYEKISEAKAEAKHKSQSKALQKKADNSDNKAQEKRSAERAYDRKIADRKASNNKPKEPKAPAKKGG